jgi:DinB superfamily
MNSIRESITGAFDEVWRRTRGRLDGLTDAEYLWEPLSDGWTLRPDAGGRWRIDGEGGGGPAPDPVPVATLAWRIGHVGLMFADFGHRLFHGLDITLDDVEFSGTAAGGLEFLETTYRDHWRDPLDAMTDERWWEPSGPAFFGYAGHPVIDVVLHVLDEFTHHGAELGVLRDLYPHR